MEDNTLQILADTIAAGEATQNEVLQFVRELNDQLNLVQAEMTHLRNHEHA